jgi:hypothetical protein
MPFNLSVWFRNLIRPRLTKIRVVLLENGKVVEISKYPEQYQNSIMKAVATLWNPPGKSASSYWFEAELVQKCSCLKRTPPQLFITCYSEDLNDNQLRQEYQIPIRLRQKMFDKVHPIFPEPVGFRSWSGRMEVKFVIPEK